MDTGANAPSEPLYLARAAVLAVQTRYPDLRGKLRAAWEGVAAWQEKTSPRPRRPLPEALLEPVHVVCRSLAALSSGEPRAQWIVISILVEAGCVGMMGTGEILRAMRAHVMMPSMNLFRSSQFPVFATDLPKNRRQLGDRQLTISRSLRSRRWLEWLLPVMAPIRKSSRFRTPPEVFRVDSI